MGLRDSQELGITKLKKKRIHEKVNDKMQVNRNPHKNLVMVSSSCNNPVTTWLRSFVKEIAKISGLLSKHQS